MHILVIINAEYGERHYENIAAHAPASWEFAVWKAPVSFPLVIDYPEEHLPDSLPRADLILSFAEHKGVAELLPEIARMTGARAVLAPIDNESWLPRGLARQLRGWLGKQGVSCVTPKPLCSLTMESYDLGRRQRVRYQDAFIAEFARYFGRPAFEIQVDPHSRTIMDVKVKRDALCGCARYVAERLVGFSVEEAEQEAGMLHHHYPCLASMGIDSDYGDTLMHVSGNILRDEIAAQIRHFRQVQYIAPGRRSDNPGQDKPKLE